MGDLNLKIYSTEGEGNSDHPPVLNQQLKNFYRSLEGVWINLG